MTILHIDCSKGATKEILLNQILNILPDPGEFIDKIKKLSISDITFDCTADDGTYNIKITSTKDHVHNHHQPEEVSGTIESLTISDTAINFALRIYDLIGEAEAKAHGVSIDKVHFHEVGSNVAIAYIICICMAVDILSPDRVISTSICTGFGKIQCSHGLLDIPAPATCFLLEDMPTFVGDREGEFCTPTGAAVVKYFTDYFE